MNESRLANALDGTVEESLAVELVAEFAKIRRDYATKTLERASPGKFVETFVQCLQEMSRGKYDASPRVDSYLTSVVENESALPDGLRLCGSRIARSIYTLRNKRSIAHKGAVDPNTYDLAFVSQGAAWIMAEMIRSSSGITMEEAGSLIDLVQAPVGHLVEEIDGMRLVHASVSTRAKILILLHSYYPARMGSRDIHESLNHKTAASIRSRLSELRRNQYIVGDRGTGYKLTIPGYNAAVAEIGNVVQSP